MPRQTSFVLPSFQVTHSARNCQLQIPNNLLDSMGVLVSWLTFDFPLDLNPGDLLVLASDKRFNFQNVIIYCFEFHDILRVLLQQIACSCSITKLKQSIRLLSQLLMEGELLI
jgi:hypothetical protein